jgi:drug/metabolite transporter (DMT)-like permease
MTAALLSLIASVAWGASDFLGGLASRRARLPLVLAGSQVAGLVALGPALAIAGQPLPPDPRLLWGLAAGVLAAGTLGLIYVALRRGPVMVMAPIAALAALLPVAVGIVGGDRVDLLIAAGIACALAGAVAASWVPGGERPPLREALIGGAVAGGAAAGTGAALSLLDWASKASAWWALGALRVGGSVTAMVLLVALAFTRSGATARLSAGAALMIAAVGLSDAGADAAFANATRDGALSIVAVLSSLYPVTTIALGAVVLRERPRRVQLAGAGLACLGVAVLAWATARPSRCGHSRPSR